MNDESRPVAALLPLLETPDFAMAAFGFFVVAAFCTAHRWVGFALAVGAGIWLPLLDSSLGTAVAASPSSWGLHTKGGDAATGMSDHPLSETQRPDDLSLAGGPSGRVRQGAL